MATDVAVTVDICAADIERSFVGQFDQIRGKDPHCLLAKTGLITKINYNTF